MSVLIDPVNAYGELFEAVQLGGILDDSKAFVDALPTSDPAVILARYRRESTHPTFDLGHFVHEHFELPTTLLPDALPTSGRPVRDHIEQLWDLLSRDTDDGQRASSLIRLPRPYVVPGGRFREIYYWDSYFTLLGLAAAGREQQVDDMLANFAHLVDTVGFIPNGNRSYFCSRSQPPYFALMVELLAKLRDDDTVFMRFLPQLEQEYAFWMAGIDARPGNPQLRLVPVEGGYLNRYWDDRSTPRPESYAEDCALTASLDAAAAATRFRHIRAACESGWDFSSRWLGESSSLASIRTTDVVPIDLNALLAHLESVLAHAHARAGNAPQASVFERRAAERRALIEALFFCERRGVYVDLCLPGLSLSPVETLATAYPLFLGLADDARVDRVAEALRDRFLCAGGWVVSNVESGQQWDSPNGWAPLEWVCYRGLLRYGHESAARVGARRWVDNNLAVYNNSGRLLEKYNVRSVGELAGGGEYGVQDGFGWTNGVLLCLLNELAGVG